MAKMKKNLTLEEQLSMINTQIEKSEEQLKEYKRQKKELERAIKTEQLEQLYDIVTSSGKTIDEVKDIIENVK